MANIISDETIEYVGILAKLELSPEEKEQAKNLQSSDTKFDSARCTLFLVQNAFHLYGGCFF